MLVALALNDEPIFYLPQAPCAVAFDVHECYIIRVTFASYPYTLEIEVANQEVASIIHHNLSLLIDNYKVYSLGDECIKIDAEDVIKLWYYKNDEMYKFLFHFTNFMYAEKSGLEIRFKNPELQTYGSGFGPSTFTLHTHTDVAGFGTEHEKVRHYIDFRDKSERKRHALEFSKSDDSKFEACVRRMTACANAGKYGFAILNVYSDNFSSYVLSKEDYSDAAEKKGDGRIICDASKSFNFDIIGYKRNMVLADAKSGDIVIITIESVTIVGMVLGTCESSSVPSETDVIIKPLHSVRGKEVEQFVCPGGSTYNYRLGIPDYYFCTICDCEMTDDEPKSPSSFLQ